MATLREIASFKAITNVVSSLSFSSDGSTLAIKGSGDRTFKLWDVTTQHEIALPHAFTYWVDSVAFSPVDATLIATGSSDGQVNLWDVATRERKATIKGHTHPVGSVSFSIDGRTLASCSGDGTVKLWDVPTLISRATFRHASEVAFAAFSPDGRTFASATVEGTIELWDTSFLMQIRREAAAEIDIRDPNLHAVIAEAIGLPPNAPILRGHLQTLIELDARNANISDLTGIEGATKLRTLDLGGKYVWAEEGVNYSNSNSISGISPLTGLAIQRLNLEYNNISDISAVSGLTDLTWLRLGQNSISDISAVAGLTNLTWLALGNNSVSDISALAGLTNLEWLVLSDNFVSNISSVGTLTNLSNLFLSTNSISDISAVARLTNLRALNLASTSISDISAIGRLTNLEFLSLQNNTISDISPLVANTGFGNQDKVYLSINPLSYQSIHTHIPTLQNRGVEVLFDKRTPHRIRIVSGNDQGGLPGTALDKPFVVKVLDERGTAFEGVPVTFTVTAGGGTLSVTNTTTDANGRAESVLTLGPNPGTNTVTVSVAGIQEGQTFTAEGIQTPKPFWIIFGDKQQGVIGEALANPFMVEVRDQSGEPLPGAQVKFYVTAGGGTLSATSVTTNSNGRAESILTLGPNPGRNTVSVSVAGIAEEQSVSAIAELPPILEDVNGDDVVNIWDLVLVASALGGEGTDLPADVNGDEVVDILDLVLVAGALGNTAAAPSAWYRDLEIAPTRTDVAQWLALAQTQNLAGATLQRGILFLEHLLVALAPKETALLPNYPNPFNPETWIPYQLSEDANVTLTIYDAKGVVLRRLELGHRLAGYYADRGRAAYWNGCNDFGEKVASGVYFYHQPAGNYSAVRKMLISK
ncbi:MAG: leucine-rich repeat domain-containing protein [Candidatus Poribacteria bacterium]|nr:leucine-rich repeat domain-containing protein [Candidatus Poribacteria bacterium]MDE0502660.1 leucine-rich repeat domain-containing protein [Candidatus Poribacteria bacterium]